MIFIGSFVIFENNPYYVTIMSELIRGQVLFAQNEIKNITDTKISEEKAFSHAILKNYFDVDFIDQIGVVTDGPNDGGIDFLYYDEEDSKVILCQSKYSDSLKFDQIISTAPYRILKRGILVSTTKLLDSHYRMQRTVFLMTTMIITNIISIQPHRLTSMLR